MSNDDSFKNTLKNLIADTLSNKRTAFLTLQSAIFTASIFIPQLRTTEILTSPLVNVTLPVLTGVLTTVAVLFAWHGKVQVEHNGTKLQLENLPERDARKKYIQPWKDGDAK